MTRKPIHDLAPGQYEDENNRLRDWRPVPDPTVLTTQQLMRELGALKEIMTTRMDGYDKAISLLQAFADRQPTIAEVVAKFEEKFRGIDTQFKERDQRVDQTAKEAKVAVDAAFASQAAAIAKSEAATTKQIDQILITLTSSVKSLDDKINGSIKTVDDKINDAKDRVAGIEQRGTGASNLLGYVGTVAMVLGAVIGAVVAVFFRGG